MPNCCGNSVKEATEDGLPGNECTCPADYGACEGAATIEIRNREYPAKYLKKFCDSNNQCVFGVDPDEVVERKLVDERSTSFFTLETQTTFNNPFNIQKDRFHFKIILRDGSEELVLPIKIISVKLKEGEILYGEKTVNNVLNNIGESVSTIIPVSYQPAEVEEERPISYKIDYEYTKRVKKDRNPDGTYNYDEAIERESFEKRFTSKIYFVDPGE